MSLCALRHAVHVEMDFINPAAESVQNFWRNLPPPVQQGAPIVGAGLLTALIVHRIERGRLKAEVHAGFHACLLRSIAAASAVD